MGAEVGAMGAEVGKSVEVGESVDMVYENPAENRVILRLKKDHTIHKTHPYTGNPRYTITYIS